MPSDHKSMLSTSILMVRLQIDEVTAIVAGLLVLVTQVGAGRISRGFRPEVSTSAFPSDWIPCGSLALCDVSTEYCDRTVGGCYPCSDLCNPARWWNQQDRENACVTHCPGEQIYFILTRYCVYR